jgi:hypothetical protein
MAAWSTTYIISSLLGEFWGPFLTSPLGANYDPRGEVVPQGWILSPGSEVIPWGVKFSVRPSILLNSREYSPLGVNEGVNIPPRDQVRPQGWSSPLEARVEVKNGPLGREIESRRGVGCRIFTMRMISG